MSVGPQGERSGHSVRARREARPRHSEGHPCTAVPGLRAQHRADSRQTSDLSSQPDFPFCPHEPHGPGLEATSLSFLEVGRVGIF